MATIAVSAFFGARAAVSRILGVSTSVPKAPEACEAPAWAPLPGLKALLSESAETEIRCCRKVLTFDVTSLTGSCMEASEKPVTEQVLSSTIVAAEQTVENIKTCEPAEERADELASEAAENLGCIQATEAGVYFLELLMCNYNFDAEKEEQSRAGEVEVDGEGAGSKGEEGHVLCVELGEVELDGASAGGVTGTESRCQEMSGEGAMGEEEEEFLEAEETLSLARSSSLSSFFETLPEAEYGSEEMGQGGSESLPILRRSFSMDDALTLLESSRPASGNLVSQRKHKPSKARAPRRQVKLLSQLPREEQRLLLVLHLMLLLPPEYEGSKTQKAQGNGAAGERTSPKQCKQPKGAKQHEARQRSQASAATRRGCKNY